MIACSSLFRVEGGFIFTNSYHRFKHLQICYLYSGLNFKSISDRTRSKQRVMEQKGKKKIPPLWRPVSTRINYAQECSKDLQVELEELQETKAKDKPESVAGIGGINVERDFKTFHGNDEERTINDSAPSENMHSTSLEIGASLMRFVKGRWGATQKNIEEEIGVKLVFPSSRNEDALVIEGTSLDSITRASNRIRSIVDEAVKSPNLDYSHFVSLPLALYPELVEKLVNFQTSILEASKFMEEDENTDSKGDRLYDKDDGNVAAKLMVENERQNFKVDIKNIRVSYESRVPTHSGQEPSKHSSSLGIEKSIFIKPATFHLTVLMLKLWNKDRVAAAAEVLQSVASKVQEALDSRPVSIRLKGLQCMKGSLAKARVVYAPVEEIGCEGRLERACQVIIDAFIEAGLVLEKDSQTKLKLHATVMNARHRKRNKKTRFEDSFDARGIFKQYGSQEWGEYLVPEAHLSQRFLFDENGYYHRCSSIPFPKGVELE